MLQTDSFQRQPPPQPPALAAQPAEVAHAYMHVSLPPGASMGSAYPPYAHPHVMPEYAPPPPWGAPPTAHAHANGNGIGVGTPDPRYAQPPYPEQYRMPAMPGTAPGSVPPRPSQVPATAPAPPRAAPAVAPAAIKPEPARRGADKPARPRKRKTAAEKAQAAAGASTGAAPTAAVAPIVMESKKHQKRREVLGRIERQHQEALTEREWYASELSKALDERQAALTVAPSLDREYQLAAARLTLKRDTLLGDAQRMHEHYLEEMQEHFSAQLARWDEEAQAAKERARSKILLQIEEQRAVYIDEKKHDGFPDTAAEQSQRSHGMRPMRKSRARGQPDEEGTHTPEVAPTVGPRHGISSGPGPLGLAIKGEGLLDKMGFSSSDLFILVSAGRLGLQFDRRLPLRPRSGSSAPNGETSPEASKREAPDGTLDAEVADVLGELDRGPCGVCLDPASVLDLLGLGGEAGAPFGGGGVMTGLLDGRVSDQGVIIVGPGANGGKGRGQGAKKSRAAAAAAAVVSDPNSLPDGAAAGQTLSFAAGTHAPASVLAATITAGPVGRLKWEEHKSLASLAPAEPAQVEDDLARIRRGCKRRRA